MKVGDIVAKVDLEKEELLKNNIILLGGYVLKLSDLTPLMQELGQGLEQLTGSIASQGAGAFRAAMNIQLGELMEAAAARPVPETEKHDMPYSLCDQLEPAPVPDAKRKARERSWEDVAEKRRLMRRRRGKHV